MAQRRRGDAGGERLVDVDYVQRVGQQPLDRVAGGDRQHLMAPSFELLREPPDELVDPVAGAPPVGRDLGYREGRARHSSAQAETFAPADALSPARLAMNSPVCPLAPSSGPLLSVDFLR